MSQRSRTDLCGGCRATGIPTATRLPLDFPRLPRLPRLPPDFPDFRVLKAPQMANSGPVREHPAPHSFAGRYYNVDSVAYLDWIGCTTQSGRIHYDEVAAFERVRGQMIDKHTLTRLRSQISRGEILLFTGAGFSLDASDTTGRSLPSSTDLKKALWEICFPDAEFDGATSLGDLYDAARRRRRAALQELLETRLRVDPGSLPDFYRLYLEFPWHRWYTLNVDDLVEAGARKFELQRPVVTTTATQIETRDRFRNGRLPTLEVIHLGIPAL